MIVERTAPLAYVVTFETAAELLAERDRNLAAGGLFLRTEAIDAAARAPFAAVTLLLRLGGGSEIAVRAHAVATPPGGLALQLEGDPAGIVAALLPPPATDGASKESATEDGDEAPGTLWERLRAMTPPQKMLLAPKADRGTRALLLQDNDPQLLFALLKNPRLSLDEVVRACKSSALGFQAAELVLKTPQWSGNVDVRVALIQNPKLPLPIALRILPTLPDAEVRWLAKGNATSAALKQAALRRVTGGG